jgi:hypothetical protein
MKNAFFCVSRPIGARLIQYLYCIALVLIAFGLVHGVISGARMMGRTMPPRSAASAAATPDAAGPAAQQQAQGQPPGPGMGMRRFRGPRPGMMGPRMMGPGRFMRGRGMMMMRGMSPPVRGMIMILLALLRAAIAWMVVRVLAEIGTAILAMKPKE